MEKQIKLVTMWHQKFGVPYKERFDGKSLDNARLRERIMLEEVVEWSEAAASNKPITDRAKELADILFTVFGTIITEGLQDEMERVFDAVYESNMSKLGEDGLPVKRADGKILKGPNYKEPILDFLNDWPKGCFECGLLWKDCQCLPY